MALLVGHLAALGIVDAFDIGDLTVVILKDGGNGLISIFIFEQPGELLDRQVFKYGQFGYAACLGQHFPFLFAGDVRSNLLTGNEQQNALARGVAKGRGVVRFFFIKKGQFKVFNVARASVMVA